MIPEKVIFDSNPERLVAKDISEVYHDKPYEYVVDIIGVTPTWQQELVLRAFEKPKEGRDQIWVGAKSGQGPGKTALASWLTQWFLATRPNAFVPCTAPTGSQLYTVLWREHAKWKDRSKIGSWFELTAKKLAIKGNETRWYAVARTPREPEALQGLHEDNMLFIVDEAPGIPEPMMEVIQGTLTTKGAYCLMIGNPTKLSGTFYNAFHKDKEPWKLFTFNSEESPIVTKEHCQNMARKFGRDSDVYKVRVLGEFPSGEIEAIFTLEEIEEAMNRVIPEPTTKEIVLGVDVARFGDNKTVIAMRQGYKIEILNKFYKQDTMITCGYILEHIQHYEKLGYSIIVNVDDTGIGGGVTDRLRELQTEKDFKASICPINNGERAFNPEMYVSLGAEMWMTLKQQLQDYQLPKDEDLVGEMTTRKKKIADSKARIKLESKEEMKRRGIQSPDTADAVVLTTVLAQSYTFLEDPDNIMGLN